jgi:UDP-N-acetyl-D-mannosaminuronate dehydrogenase
MKDMPKKVTVVGMGYIGLPTAALIHTCNSY